MSVEGDGRVFGASQLIDAFVDEMRRFAHVKNWVETWQVHEDVMGTKIRHIGRANFQFSETLFDSKM